MPLSRAQKGAIGQFAFLATALATGKGEVEAYTPAADNEGRDAEIRRHLKSKPGISIQVKVAFYLPRTINRQSKRLYIDFGLRAERVQNDPRLWYFFAFYDPKELRFHSPIFLVPSEVFHKKGRRGTTKAGEIWFVLTASLAAESHDQWSRYQVAPKDLGKRLLAIVDESTLTARANVVKLPPDAVWLSRTRRASVSARRTRAA